MFLWLLRIVDNRPKSGVDKSLHHRFSTLFVSPSQVVGVAQGLPDCQFGSQEPGAAWAMNYHKHE
jgi:hypothetical protein